MIVISFIFIIVLFILLANSNKKAKKSELQVQFLLSDLSSQKKKYEQEKELSDTNIASLESRVVALSKYEGILDAEIKANEILSEAKYELGLAKEEVVRLKQNALMVLNNATLDAKSIIEQADIRAVEIAGEAYNALQNAKDLEKTAKAMKNIIEGYGSQYLIPNLSLLDDLAQEFSHTQAGEMLKLAREKTRLMIKHGTSAKCDYVEANRKEIAINFVLDAFNGKVDTILLKVKKDNYGVLQQQIKDAYQVVNNNGKAFRNAVITKEFVDSRVEELKWAVITQELKWQEQEEQKRIKEQIREEEKARREFEKAIREAQKEEEILKRLIEKAQKEVVNANEEQKLKFEQQLSELEGKLKIAEDKNQRALSMAQQTKAGNVYIISNIGSFGENVFKIGMTRRLEPLDRVKELGDASVPFDFDVHTFIFSEDAPKLEKELHKKFIVSQMNKVNPRKEFFKVNLNDVRTEIEAMGIEAKWTMKAEALQYRESLTIDEAIKKDATKKLEWENYQIKVEELMVDTDEELLN